MAINTYLSKITINVNELNAPIKRHREGDWIKKIYSLQYVAYKRLRTKDTYKLKARGWKTIFHVNRNDGKTRPEVTYI